MKFKVGKRKASIPWIDGAVLHFNFPLITELLDTDSARNFYKRIKENPESKNDKALLAPLGMDSITMGLVGWDGILDEDTGKPLEFNEEIKSQIIASVIMDRAMHRKIKTALAGALGNLQTGLIAPSNSATQKPNAVNAKQGTAKKPTRKTKKGK